MEVKLNVFITSGLDVIDWLASEIFLLGPKWGVLAGRNSSYRKCVVSHEDIWGKKGRGPIGYRE
jgi:hypothetical protein